MRIKMITTAAGPDGVWPAGTIQDVSDVQARAMIAQGFAEAVETPIEEALDPAPAARETATAPAQRKRKPKASR